jgi:hypothetical protein
MDREESKWNRTQVRTGEEKSVPAPPASSLSISFRSLMAAFSIGAKIWGIVKVNVHQARAKKERTISLRCVAQHAFRDLTKTAYADEILEVQLQQTLQDSVDLKRQNGLSSLIMVQKTEAF